MRSIFFLLLLPLLSFASAARAQEFSTWDPAATLPGPPDWSTAPPPLAAVPGEGFFEADSVEMIVGRAQIKLSEAADHESAARRAFATFKSLGVRDSGAKPNAAGEASALASYVGYLQKADEIYVQVIDDLGHAAVSAPGTVDPVVEQARQMVEKVEVEVSLADAACFASPADCAQPNPDHVAYLEEIQHMLGVLDGAGPTSMNPEDVLTSAQLLHQRAALAIRIARIAGHDLMLEQTIERGPDGKPKPLPIAEGAGPKPGTQARYVPKSPYR